MATAEVLTPAQVYELVKSVAGQPIPIPNAVAAVAIVLKESGGNTAATNVNSNGTVDRGLWQWNNSAWPNITDAMAFDKTIATQKAYEVSNGFSLTGFGPWIGHGAQTLEQEFQRTTNNQRAYTNAQTAVGSTGGSTGPNWAVVAPLASAGELALLKSWGLEDNGWRVKEPDQDAYLDLSDDEFDDFQKVVADHINNDGTIKTGWLNAAKRALGVPTSSVLGVKYTNALASLIHSRQNRFGGPDPSLLNQIGEAVATQDIGAIEGLEWGRQLGNVLGILVNPDFWKRIGLGALGLAVVIIAIVLYNKDSITAVASKGFLGKGKAAEA